MNNMAKTVSEMYGESVLMFFWFCWVVLLLGRNFFEAFVCLFGTNTLSLFFVGR